MDYKERLKQEYLELKERLEKLHRMLVKNSAKTLDFEFECPVSLLEDQEYYMENYLKILEIRAEIEGIEL